MPCLQHQPAPIDQLELKYLMRYLNSSMGHKWAQCSMPHAYHTACTATFRLHCER